jgi:hypothetical protein
MRRALGARAGRRAPTGVRRFALASDVPAALRLFYYRELVTLSGSDITGMTDKYNVWGAATTPGADPDDIASVHFKRGRAWDHDESASEYFQVGGTLAQQRIFHNPGAQGVTLGFLARSEKDADSTQVPFGTYAEADAASGVSCRHDTAGASSRFMRFQAGNSSGVPLVSVSTAQGSLPSARTYCFVFSLRTHATEANWRIYQGTLAEGLVKHAEGSFTGSPSNVDATSLARIGVRGGSLTWFFHGLISEVVGVASWEYGPQVAGALFSEIVS